MTIHLYDLLTMVSVGGLSLIILACWLMHYWRVLAIKEYTCAAAQLDAKRANKAAHRKFRRESDKMLLEVLDVIYRAARTGGSEVVVPLTSIAPDTAYKKKMINSVKESLRARGFTIIPPAQDSLRISWDQSVVRRDKDSDNKNNTA